MSDVSMTVVILTYNEEKHIERCIRSLRLVASKIHVVDSFSTDRTVKLAKSLGAEVMQRAFVNHAEQFQWALDNLSIESDWVMRMDADEYLEPDLQQELRNILAKCVPDDVAGFYIRRKVFFYGKWIRHGGFYPHTLLRIWRNGQGWIEQRWMDEHIVLSPDSKTHMLEGHLVDDNLKGITFWINKHNSYASREMVDLLNRKYPLLERDESLKAWDDPQAKWKRILKDNVYSRLPLILRSTLYFIYRYFLRLGFLDGNKGFIWHFMQGYWYRALVDVKIMEIEAKAGGDVEKIRRYLYEDHGIKL
jgi:glycosyltransferase involved in cell wall biosynthesis